MPLRLIIISLIVVWFPSCKSSSGKQHQSSVLSIISERLGSANLEYNETRDVVLAIEKQENAGGILRFLIIRASDQKILEEGSFRPGYIKWINRYELELLDLPGALPNDASENNYKRIIKVPSPN